MEKVRRFVSRCLNPDLQRELAKLSKSAGLTAEHRADTEIKLREKFEIDWGTIPGVDKPFLKQPGAEKFLFWLNLRPKFHSSETELGDGHMEIVCHVNVFTKKTGEEAFEGPSCSCTTMESNYRFRWAERAIKPPQDEADKLKAAGLGKWKKKRVWAKGKPMADEWVWLDRVENPNIHDERNKVRQIGEKRALVKCIRNMGAISEIFTSDPMEWEIPDEDEGSPEDDAKYTDGGRRIVVPSEAEQNWEKREKEGLEHLTPAQRDVVESKMKSANPPAEPVLTWIYHQESETFEIDGPQELLTANKDILGKLWNGAVKKIVTTGEQFEDLKHELEIRKITFKRKE